WRTAAPELVLWALSRLFNRDDRFGAYGSNGPYTAPGKTSGGARPGVVNEALLRRHFTATGRHGVIGAHTLCPRADATPSVGGWAAAEWDTRGAYALHPEGDFRSRLTDWIRSEFVRLCLWQLKKWHEEEGAEKDKPKTHKVTTQLVTNVIQALRGMTVLSSLTEAPAWIDGGTGPDPARLLAMPNGILDLDAAAAADPDCLLPRDHRFFTTIAAPFPYNPNAPKPVHWLKFLNDIWGHDPESILCLQEWFGYVLTTDTSRQKILFVIGPTRGGKGTIAKVLTAITGAANVVTPTLGSLAGPFGLEPLLNKTLAIISDARLSGHHDASRITETLLSISGEDDQTVNRKHKPAVVGRLPARFVLFSNLLPRLVDTSGAFANRLSILRLTKTFKHKVDRGLFGRLRTELPGILLWAIAGLDRLRQHGEFTQPASARPLTDQMRTLSSRTGAFVEERCIVGGPELKVMKAELYAEWCSYCTSHGVKEPGTEETFGRDLFSTVENLSTTRFRVNGELRWHYTGIRIRTSSDPIPDDPDAPAEDELEGTTVPSGRRYTDPEDRPRQPTRPASAERYADHDFPLNPA
ncbi:MAG TPA: phage/plasmid primase, P4 family, partial [Urbifossiella sp.]|nr:phage/plasmid primase, P4 family [Urbifossiella sp.]